MTNLHEFFQRFRELNVRSNPELDRLVQTAQQAVRGVRPQALRDDQSLRQQLAKQLSAVASSVDGLLVDRPRRRILRPMATVQAQVSSQTPVQPSPADRPAFAGQSDPSTPQAGEPIEAASAQPAAAVA